MTDVSQRILEVIDPESGEVIGEVERADGDTVERALAIGEAATRKPLPPAFERSRILMDAAAGIRSGGAEFATLIATEGVKTIREAHSEVARCIMTLQLCAEEAKRIGGEVISMEQAPAGLGKLGFTTRQGAGLVVAITPFNDPLNLVAHKIGPAVALGVPVLLKAHPKTPLSAVKLCDTLVAAGVPRDLLQVVHGGAEVGSRLVSDRRPRIVSFTGGAATGRAIATKAGFKKIIMELGGVAINVVAGDAELDATADAIHSAAFYAAGQNCVHAQRVIVEKSVALGLRDRLLSRAEAMHLGPKLDERTDMGCCIDEEAGRRIDGLIRKSIEAGAELLTGGFVNGTRVSPTWLMIKSRNHPLVDTEVFGPVAMLEIVDDFSEALCRVRDADDSLHVAVFTSSLQSGLAVYDAANSATVLINESTDFRIDGMPFGGWGQSGMGREGVRYTLEAFSEPKLLIIQGQP